MTPSAANGNTSVASDSRAPAQGGAAAADSQLTRALGVRQLATTIFNYTVGSGIFALPAVAVAHLGGAAPLAYLVCMVVMALVLLCFAEAGSRVSRTGGVYAYVETGLGPFVGFVAGTMLFLTGLFGGAAVAVLFANSVSALIGFGAPWFTTAMIVAAVTLFTFINVRGVAKSARMLEFITAVKVLPLLLFVIIGVAFVHRQNFAWDHMPDVSTLLGTAGVVIFAFSGIESALAPSGEVRAPSRTVPMAAFMALGAATVLYLSIQWVALGIEGLRLGTEKVTPLANAAASFAGPPGRTVMIAAATISMLGYLSANILSTPRCLFALAQDGYLPRAFRAVHPRFRTPHIAIITHGVLVMALALSGTFEGLVVFTNLTGFVLYILCAIAVLQLRRRDVRTDGAPFIIPGGPLIPIAACLANIWLIYATGGRSDLIGLAAVLLIAVSVSSVRAWVTRGGAGR